METNQSILFKEALEIFGNIGDFLKKMTCHVNTSEEFQILVTEIEN